MKSRWHLNLIRVATNLVYPGSTLILGFVAFALLSSALGGTTPFQGISNSAGVVAYSFFSSQSAPLLSISAWALFLGLGTRLRDQRVSNLWLALSGALGILYWQFPRSFGEEVRVEALALQHGALLYWVTILALGVITESVLQRLLKVIFRRRGDKKSIEVPRKSKTSVSQLGIDNGDENSG